MTMISKSTSVNSTKSVTSVTSVATARSKIVRRQMARAPTGAEPMEAAEQASANALQAGLFDMGGEVPAHDLVKTVPWSDKRRLQEDISSPPSSSPMKRPREADLSQVNEVSGIAPVPSNADVRY